MVKKRQNYRKIYEQHYGPIPDKYQIHHIDFNCENNEPSNLIAVTPEEHAKIHIEAKTMYRGADPTKWVSGASEAGKLGGAAVWKNVSVETRKKIMSKRSITSTRNTGKQTSENKKQKISASMKNKPKWVCNCGKVMTYLKGNIKQHQSKCKAW